MNFAKIRQDFPILKRTINGKPLVYFDNASTTQKPQAVIGAMSEFYLKYNANIHRGIHTLSQEATNAYETVRDQVRDFIGARYREEIVFTSGTTDSLNLVAAGLAEQLQAGDEIILSELEHHSNIVPWQMIAKRKGLKLKFIPVVVPPPKIRGGEGGLLSIADLDMNAFEKLLTAKTKIVAITQASNVLGTITPLSKIIRLAHQRGALVIVDAAQSIAHLPINVRRLDCDFLAFSGHKLYGPTGVGVLYGKKALLEKLAPHKFGGHMIERVTKDKTTFAGLPQKFEGGTAPIAEVIGLGAAIIYLRSIGWKAIQAHEQELTRYALKKLASVAGLRLLGPVAVKHRLPIFSFALHGIPAHDVASLLDARGIAVRSGHHCTQVLHTKLNLEATTRASLGLYNTTQEIDLFAAALKDIKHIFHV